MGNSLYVGVRKRLSTKCYVPSSKNRPFYAPPNRKKKTLFGWPKRLPAGKIVLSSLPRLTKVNKIGGEKPKASIFLVLEVLFRFGGFT